MVDAFATTKDVTAKQPVSVRIDGHSGWSVDLTTGDRGVDLFRTEEGSSYRLQPGRTTRMVALDVGGATPLVMGIEPGDGHTLRQLLDVAADDAAASTHVR
jgi:putative component of toxin-antitoxin plasmid stabilization module